MTAKAKYSTRLGRQNNCHECKDYFLGYSHIFLAVTIKVKNVTREISSGALMIELELVVRELERLYEKEKSLRRKVMLETAIKSVKDYSKDVA